jgi:catechol 2,3-dioxygenase-like lactoylglutathione lyase family enzyme
MIHAGINHVGLATHDMDKTLEFYCDVIGFKIVRFDRIDIAEGGHMRHVFLDMGNNQLLSFIEPNSVEGIKTDFDAGINKGLGVPNSFFHIAFEAESSEGIEEIREHLDSSGIKVSPVIDHEWCKSLYFLDPINGLSLEYCFFARELNEDDRTFQYRLTAPRALLDVDVDGLLAAEESRLAEVASKK